MFCNVYTFSSQSTNKIGYKYNNNNLKYLAIIETYYTQTECENVEDCFLDSIDSTSNDNIGIRCRKFTTRSGETGGVCCIKTNFDGCNDRNDCCGRNADCINGRCESTKDNDNNKETGTESRAVITGERTTDKITFLGIKNVDPTVIWVICALIATFTVLICIGFYLCVYKKQDDIFNDAEENSFSSSKGDEIRAEIEMEKLERDIDDDQNDEEEDHQETPPTSTIGYLE